MTEEKPAREDLAARPESYYIWNSPWLDGNSTHALLVSFSAKLSPLVSQAVVLLGHQSSPSAVETRHG